VTDGTSGVFGVLEILKAKVDWICGAVEKKRNSTNSGLGIVLGKSQLEPKKAGRKLLEIFMERGFGGRCT
jgi:hypothetical protein